MRPAFGACGMNEVYINGRPDVDWEVAVIERARRCERTRELELLKGVLTGDARPVRHAPSRKRRAADLSLDVLR